MSREATCVSCHFTICFALLIFVQSTIAIPVFHSRKLTLRPDELLLTYIPSEGLLSRADHESWSDVLENIQNDHMQYLPFRRLIRNTGSGDEARYQIRHVGDLPMFRFG
ncbi:hypothetical protein LOAG_01044 [Loa loa]|uniref:Uncharacterized protein n=1 Tax=Loa loa TaxID=7209 RepID=A0A1I7W1Z8_LOALO|nr:hypothetical protein LOAG_01044 [Loa loa]EFO27438.1 hypothetical protein LOAG_01044 [Loa loa]